jgi:hypothetical protein
MHCAACIKPRMHTAATVLFGFAGAAAASVGLINSATGNVEAFTDLMGNLQLNSVYQPENDLPEQRAALQELYTVLGGDYWGAAYKQLSYIEEVEAFANASSASSES